MKYFWLTGMPNSNGTRLSGYLWRKMWRWCRGRMWNIDWTGLSLLNCLSVISSVKHDTRYFVWLIYHFHQWSFLKICEQSFDTECETLEEEECNTIYEEVCEPVYKVRKIFDVLVNNKRLQLLKYSTQK